MGAAKIFMLHPDDARSMEGELTEARMLGGPQLAPSMMCVIQMSTSAK